MKEPKYNLFSKRHIKFKNNNIVTKINYNFETV